MKKKNLAMLLGAGMIIAFAIASFPTAAAKVGANGMEWNSNDASVAQRDVPYDRDLKRTNASGDKIASNAQSGDFPGLYFYWNDQQKDYAYLKVEPSVFSWFEDNKFSITAKNANTYWEYEIKVQDDQKKTVDGCYVFEIPKNLMYIDGKKEVKDTLKNINMVFLDGLWRTYDIEIVKEWSDGNPERLTASFTNGYTIGKKTERLFANETKQIAFEEVQNPKYELEGITINGESVDKVDFTAEAGGNYIIVFTNKSTAATVIIEKIWLDENGDLEAPAPAEAIFTGNYSLGQNKVPADTEVAFSEEQTEGYKLIEITVNDDVVSDVNFIAQPGETYTVVFTNKKLKLDNFVTEEDQKIASHADESNWLGFGITCLFGDSSQGPEAWYVEFDNGFFDKYAGVGFDFKASGTHYYIAVAKDDKTRAALIKEYGNNLICISADALADNKFYISDYIGAGNGGNAYLLGVWQWN